MAAQTNDCEVEGLARGPGAADSGDRGQRGGDSYQLQEGMFGMAAIKKKNGSRTSRWPPCLLVGSRLVGTEQVPVV